MQGTFKQKGFGLLEVLMTALVLSIGLLGAAVLQTKSAKLASRAKHAASAAVLANELASAMYANPLELTAGEAGAYFLIIDNNKVNSLDLSCTEAPCFEASTSSNWWSQDKISGRDCRTQNCWAMEQAIFDIIQVREKAKEQLPNGKIKNIFHADNKYYLTIGWDDPTSNVIPATTLGINYETKSGFDFATRVRQVPYELYFHIDENDSSKSTPKAKTLGDTRGVPPDVLSPWMHYLGNWLNNIRSPVPEHATGYSTTLSQSLVNLVDGYYINNTVLNSICADSNIKENGICDTSRSDTPVETPPPPPEDPPITDPGGVPQPAFNPLNPNNGNSNNGTAPISRDPLPPSIAVNGGWTGWTYDSSKGGNSRNGDCGLYRRTCTNPAPAYGGNNCSGSSTDCRKTCSSWTVNHGHGAFEFCGINWCKKCTGKKWWKVCSPPYPCGFKSCNWTETVTPAKPNC